MVRRALCAATAIGLLAEIALGHLARPAAPHAPALTAVQLSALALAAVGAGLVTAAALGGGSRAPARTALGAGLLLTLLAVGAGFHLEAALGSGAAAPPLAPAVGGGFALVMLYATAEDRPGRRSLAALAALAAVIALASLSDHARRAFVPLPWTLLGPVAALAVAVTAAAAAAWPRPSRRAAMLAAGTLAAAVGALGVGLHAGAPSHALLALPFWQRAALPPPVLAPAALALAGLWAIHLASDPGPPYIAWVASPLRRPGRNSRESGQPPKRPGIAGSRFLPSAPDDL